MRCNPELVALKKPIYAICILTAALVGVFMFSDHAVNDLTALSSGPFRVRYALHDTVYIYST